MIKYAYLAMIALAAVPATAQTDAKPAAAPAPTPRFTLDTPMEQIAADPKGREALNTVFPGFLESEFYENVKRMSLKSFEASSQGFIQFDQMRQIEALLPKL